MDVLMYAAFDAVAQIRCLGEKKTFRYLTFEHLQNFFSDILLMLVHNSKAEECFCALIFLGLSFNVTFLLAN